MQIHEITQQKIDEGIGSFLGKIGGGISNVANRVAGAVSPIGPAKDAYASAVRPQQIKMLADKVYTGWKQYEKTLLQSNPDARETGMYEQALLAFVSKNLLGGQYLPNVINKKQIMDLVKQLSAPDSVSEADEITGAVKSGAPTPAERAKLQQKIAAADKGATPPSPAGADKPTAPPPAAMTPQKEKDLWLKLTQQASVAQAQAPGTSSQSVQKSNPSGTQSTQGDGDARTYAQQFTQSIDSAVVKGLPIFGNTAVKNIGDNNVQGTGNPVADALLLMAGFRGI